VAQDETGLRELYVVSLNRKLHPVLLGECESYFSWSPDSKTLACSAYISGNEDIYLLKAEAGFPAVRLTNDLGPDSEPSWSPDGKYITYVAKTADKYEIYRMRSNGSEQLKLTDNKFDNEFPIWSSDGQFVYFLLGNADNYNGTWDIYCMTKDGSDPVPLARRLLFPIFSVTDASP
jgi:Tol biopolymer transport system component